MRATTDLNATGVESPAEYMRGYWVGMALGCVITAGLGVIVFLR